jgi:PPM family protein phosphatase
MHVRAESISRSGGRKYNEDYTLCEISNSYGCFLVADGLGGHHGGDIASETACLSFIEAFKKEPDISVSKLETYLSFSARAMDELQEKRGMQDTVKTTMVILLLGVGLALWAHIGDSRLYLFKSGSIAYQTKDHSLPQRLVDIGEIEADQIRSHEDRNRLLRVFDGSNNCHFEIVKQPVAVGRADAFLLCTDGFWEYVLESDMENDLKEASNPEVWLSLMEKRLLDRVDKSHDNYSALAIMIS